MTSKRLRVANPTTFDDDSHSLSAPPLYISSGPLPPSYTSPELATPAGFPRNSTQRSALPISSTYAESADTGWGSPPPSVDDSETCVSDDAGQVYQITDSSFNSSGAGALNTVDQYRDTKTVLSDSSGDRDTAASEDSASVLSTPAGSTVTVYQPRYVYYHVYSDGESVPAKTSFTEDDPYLGRIIAKRIAPPHTATSIKRYLSKQEGISDCSRTILFSSLSSPSPLEDQSYVSILATDGPGYLLTEPMALVVSDPPKAVDPSPPIPAELSQPPGPAIVTVTRQPNPLYVVQNMPPVMPDAEPIVAQINQKPTKEEIKRQKAEEKKRKKAEAKARTEKLAEQLKASAKQRAASGTSMSQDQVSVISGRSSVRGSRVPGEASLFGGLARLTL